MGYRCFVVGYCENYNNGTHVRAYSLPTDEEMK